MYDPKDKKAWDFTNIAWKEGNDALFNDSDNDFVNENNSHKILSFQKILKTQKSTISLASKDSHPIKAPKGDEACGNAQDQLKDNLEKDNLVDNPKSNRLDNNSEADEEIICTATPTAPRQSGRQKFPSQRALENTHPHINVFRSNQIPRSYEHMVSILATLAQGKDNKSPDKSLTLKEAMSSPYWKQ